MGRALICGQSYGGTARKIYEEFCALLPWNPKLAGHFGRQQKLFAAHADEKTGWHVWFITHSNRTNTGTKDFKNYILDEIILEVVLSKEKKMERVNKGIATQTAWTHRIIFAKNGRGSYEFLGVYAVLENLPEHTAYKRILRDYPVEGSIE